jgi:epoxyqueuosine reductase
MHQDFPKALNSLLREHGASVVGFADLQELPPDVRQDYPSGVSFGVALNPAIIARITNGPTREYEDEYKRVNALLGRLAETSATYLRQQGFEASPVGVTKRYVDEQSLHTDLPQKTVATRAGLGWIGKCALLVTKEFGSAVRFGSILTNAPLPAAEAINTSLCGDCEACVKVCPGSAPSGALWQAGMRREAFFDAHACYQTTTHWRATRHLSRHICGMCIAACPWTQRYLAGK